MATPAASSASEPAIEPRPSLARAIPSGLLFALPAFAVLAAIFAIPLAQTIGYSFTDWRGGAREANFVGLDNYVSAFEDPRFLTALWHNAALLIAIPFEVLLAAFVASVLREKIHGWRIYRFLLVMPWIISITIVGYTWIYFLSPTGIINEVLRLVGLGEYARAWLADPMFALPAIVLVLVWRDTGFAAILFYSRLLSVDNSVYEAASLDGAKRMRRFLYIDLPLLRGVIRLFVVLMSIWLFSFVFNYVYVMTGGGPGYASTVVELEIFRNAFRLSDMGYGAAISVILLLVTLPILIIQVRLQLRSRGMG